MDAAHDYAAATRMLNHTLPAYISYTQNSRVKVGPVDKTHSETVVVRTSDGKIMKGHAVSVQVGGSNSASTSDVVLREAFHAACYTPTAATLDTYNGRRVEKIALKSTCDKDQRDDENFTSLFIDPQSYTPLGVTGGEKSDQVDASIEEAFTSVDGRLMPAAFRVNVVGKGWMSWLSVVANIEFSQYRFLEKLP